MTEKLYYDNVYLKTFEAQVISCTAEEHGFLIELDQTAFYPEGGGQPSDQGTLNDALITDVITQNGLVLHKSNVDFLPGTPVKGVLNWPRRHRFMQQHLGQHLLSAAFKNLFNAATVGFHMGEDYVTIDLDQKLSSANVQAAEDLANDVIYDDLAVEALYPETEALAEMPLRKMPKVSENIRIIKVGDFDYTPCGGTHPSTTGQIGIIKVRKFSNYKSGIRIEFVCGRLALEDYREKLNTVSTLATDLSVKDHEVTEAYNKLKISILDTQDRLKNLKVQLAEMEAHKMLSEAEVHSTWHLVYKTFNNYDFNDLRNLSSAIGALCPTAVRVLLNEESEKATVLIEIPDNNFGLSAKLLLKTVLEVSDGKGGGSDKSAQGSSPQKVALAEATADLLPKIKTVLTTRVD